MIVKPSVTGQVVGYRRVSTLDQNPERQLEGQELDRLFEDRLSGKTVDRPQLQAMLAHVRAGDTVLVHSLDRLGRNLLDLRRLVSAMTGRGVRVRFVKEGLEFTGEDSPMATLFLSILGSFAEFERSLMRERQREGIALAKRKGVYKGRAASLSAAQIDQVRRRAAAGEPKAELAREFGVSRQTVYNALVD